jgi:hypothetical protein
MKILIEVADDGRTGSVEIDGKSFVLEGNYGSGSVGIQAIPEETQENSFGGLVISEIGTDFLKLLHAKQVAAESNLETWSISADECLLERIQKALWF